MPNPFREAMSGSQGPRNLAPNLLQFMQNFRGNPMQILQERINSSGITPEQYNQLHSAAEDIARKMMGVFPRR